MNHPIWQTEDGELLKQLRVKAHLDALVFSRANTISLAQLQELEGQGEGSFYTVQIKSFIGFKLLRKLGHEPVTATPAPIDSPMHQVPLAPVQSAVTASLRVPLKNAEPENIDLGMHLPAFSYRPSTPLIDTKAADAGRPDLIETNSLLAGFGQRIHPKWAFRSLFFAAGVWALYSTPWGTPTLPPSLQDDRPTVVVSRPSHPSTALSKDTPLATVISKAQNVKSVSAEQTFPSSLTNETAPQHAAAQACDWGHQGNSFQYAPVAPIKAGNYIHFVALQDSSVCVRDQQNRLTQLQLKAGMSKSVFGDPPFMVHSPVWANLHLFFQGRRVTGTPEGDAHWVFNHKVLEEPSATLPTAALALSRP